MVGYGRITGGVFNMFKSDRLPTYGCEARKTPPSPQKQFLDSMYGMPIYIYTTQCRRKTAHNGSCHRCVVLNTWTLEAWSRLGYSCPATCRRCSESRCCSSDKGISIWSFNVIPCFQLPRNMFLLCVLVLSKGQVSRQCEGQRSRKV